MNELPSIISLAITPSNFYKYRCWNNEEHKTLLTHQEIYFPAPIQFNDPFDGAVKIRIDKLDQAGLRRLFYRYYPKAKYKAKPKYIKPGNVPYLVEQLTLDAQTKTFVFSGSSKWNSILMWSHYSECHRGFCVNIDVKSFVTENARNGRDMAVFKIHYTEEYPELIPMESFANAFYAMVVKAKDWEYEQEYRVVLNDFAGQKFKLKHSMIREIYLGCAMKNAAIREIIEILRTYSSKPRLYQIHKSEFGFSLERKEIRYH